MIKGMLAALLLSVSMMTQAITISEETVRGPIKFYVLSAEFTKNSLNVLRTFLAAHPEEINLLLHSTGGHATDLPAMMQAVHEHGQVRGIVTADNVCLSACAFLASSMMEVYGKLHYHAVYADPKQLEAMGKLTHFEQQMLHHELGRTNSHMGYIMEDILDIPKMIVRSAVIEKEGWVVVRYRGKVSAPVDYSHVAYDEPELTMMKARGIEQKAG